LICWAEAAAAAGEDSAASTITGRWRTSSSRFASEADSQNKRMLRAAFASGESTGAEEAARKLLESLPGSFS
jgi:hypothetical protein